MLSGKPDARSCAFAKIEEGLMPRVAFRLRIKAGKEEQYDRAHRNVWPELITRLKQVGISDYSIFRRDLDLFLVMHVENFEAAWHTLDSDPINSKWQQEMAGLFDPIPGLKPGEKFATMREVFHLE
jgi:L-rhamnose mutarotase